MWLVRSDFSSLGKRLVEQLYLYYTIPGDAIHGVDTLSIGIFHGGHVCGQLQSTDTKYPLIKEGGTLKLTTDMAAVKNLYTQRINTMYSISRHSVIQVQLLTKLLSQRRKITSYSPHSSSKRKSYYE